MLAIKNPQARKLLRNEITKFNREYGEFLNERYTLSTFDNEAKLVNQRRRTAIKAANQHASPILLTSYIGLNSLVDLGVFLTYRPMRRKLLPAKWLGSKRDANHFMGEFILSATNYILATIYLCESGLEWPARVLLRTVKELLNIGVVLVSDPVMMKKYLALPAINDRKDWYGYFSRPRITGKLSELNRGFGVPENYLTRWVSNESKEYSMLSKHAHGSFLATVLGAYHAPFDEPNRLRYSFYGAASTGIQNTLVRLNWEILYFNLMLWRLVIGRHNFKFSGKQDHWKSVYVLAKLHESLNMKRA